MAATILLKVGDLTATGANAITAGSTAPVLVIDGTTVEAVLADNVYTFAGYGTLKATEAGKLTFTALAAAPGGTYTVTQGTNNANITVFDGAALTSAVSVTGTGELVTIMMGAGADSTEGMAASVTGGAGNDTIASGNLNATLLGGAGADYIRFSIDPPAGDVTSGPVIDSGADDDTVVVTASGGNIQLTAPITLGSGADSVMLSQATAGKTLTASVLGGAGADTMTAGSLASATFTGGTDADTFVLGTGAVSMSVTDYSFAEGDVITDRQVAHSSLGGAINNLTGTFTDTNISATVAPASDHVYKVRLTDSLAAATDYWSVAPVNTTGEDTVSMDLSSYTTDSYVLDAQGVSAANITLGSNTGHGASISLQSASSSASSITLGKAGGTVAVTNAIVNGSAANTVFNFTGEVSVDASSVSSNGTVVTGVVQTGKNSIITYTEKGNTAAKKTVGIIDKGSSGAMILMTATGALDKYVSYNSNNGTIDASALTGAQTFRLNNDEGVSDKYTGITSVTGGAGGGVYVGANLDSETTYFELSADTVGSQIWNGGTKGVTDVTLGAVSEKHAADTIWFGTTDGAMNVKGFDDGFGSTADILYLYDVADVKNAELYSSALGIGSLIGAKAATASGAQTVFLTLSSAVGNTKGAQLKVRDSAGTVNYIAMASIDNAATVDADDGVVQADYVISKLAAAVSWVSYGNAETSLRGAGMSYNVRLNNDSLATTKFVAIDNADLTKVADDAKMTLVGAADTGIGSTLLAGGAQADIWGGSNTNDTFCLSTVKGAANTVWFGAADGADSVMGWSAAATTDNAQTDTVNFYDQASVKTLFAAYGVISDSSDLRFVNKTVTGNSLRMMGDASSFYIQTQAGTAKAVRADKSRVPLTAAADTKVYIGYRDGNTVLTASGSAGATIRLNNDTDTYYADISTANASGVTGGNVVLVGTGMAGTKDVLTGGYGTQNDYWGGGKSEDLFNGKDGITDVAWFDAGDGADTAKTFGKEDKVYLYNTASIDTVKVSAADKDLVITVSDGDTLKITDGAANEIFGADGITVGLNDGSSYYVSQTTSGTTTSYGLVKKA